MKTGILYVATGSHYIDQAIRSAQSVNKHMPHIPITIFTDREIDPALFENVIIIDEPTFTSGDKIKCIAQSPYDKTVYLDADTIVLDDFSELFVLMDEFDFAAAHANRRRISTDISPVFDAYYKSSSTPDSFPELNSGVIVFRRCKPVKELFQDWERVFWENQSKSNTLEIPKRKKVKQGIADQPFLRSMLYNSDVRFSTLTPEYNCIWNIGFVTGTVKIVHFAGWAGGALSSDFVNDFTVRINSSDASRVFRASPKELVILKKHRMGRRGMHTIRSIALLAKEKLLTLFGK